MRVTGWAIFKTPPVDYMARVEQLLTLCYDKEHLERESIALCSLKTEKEWLNSKEAAAYLGIPVRSLFNRTSNGKLPHYKFGRSIRFKLLELRELLLAQPRGVYV